MTKPARFTITPHDLRNLLAPVAPLAGTDEYLPVLCAVLIRGKGRTITATATDRYRAGITRHELDAPRGEKQDPVPEFSALVNLAGVKQILAAFKPRRATDHARLTVRVNSKRLSIEGPTYWGHPAEIAIPHQPGKFPDVHRIILEALTPRESNAYGFGINPEFFAEFKHAARRGDTLAVYPGANPSRPVALTAGDYFAGILMPRRIVLPHDSGQHRESGLDLLDREIRASHAAGRDTWAELLGGTPAVPQPASAA